MGDLRSRANKSVIERSRVSNNLARHVSQMFHTFLQILSLPEVFLFQEKVIFSTTVHERLWAVRVLRKCKKIQFKGQAPTNYKI